MWGVSRDPADVEPAYPRVNLRVLELRNAGAARGGRVAGICETAIPVLVARVGVAVPSVHRYQKRSGTRRGGGKGGRGHGRQKRFDPLGPSKPKK